MYSLSGYGRMICDHDRMAAYLKALRHSINPNSVVVDIGTGTGILAILACRLGARRVFAIETDNVIEIARAAAAANGFSERIEFFHHDSTVVNLPEKADVVVSDLRGVLPPLRHHIPAIIDARKRMLRNGGVLIPKRDALWVAAIEAPDLYERYVKPWTVNDYDIDLSAARRFAVNSWRQAQIEPEQLVSEAALWTTLDYMTIEDSAVKGAVNLVATRDAIAHGLGVWFDAILSDEAEFSNRPGNAELIYGRGFFPWPEPVKLCAGDVVSVKISANLVGEDYVWRWDTQVNAANGDPKTKALFRQSTFYGLSLSASRLRKAASNYVPSFDQELKIDLFALGLIDGKTSLGEIAQQLSVSFPERFPDWNSAFNRVTELAGRVK